MSLDDDIEKFNAAKAELRQAVAAELRPLMFWIDRQLRRWPRLYAWLSR